MARKEPKKVRIADITEPDMYVIVKATVDDAEISPNAIIRQKGILRDATGECEFVIWESSREAGVDDLVMGHTYEIAKAYTKVWHPPVGDDRFSVSITKWTKITDVSNVPSGQMKLDGTYTGKE